MPSSLAVDETLRFVGPEDEQVVAPTFFRGFVKAPEDVHVEEHLQERVHVAALHLEFLRHSDADNLSAVDVGEVECVRTRTKDLGDLRCDECLEVIGDRLFHAADLLGWLSEKTIGEVLNQLAPAGGLMARGEVAHRFVQVALIEQQVVGVFQSHIGTDLAQCFQGAGDVGLRLVTEEALVTGLAETGSGIDDCLREACYRGCSGRK